MSTIEIFGHPASTFVRTVRMACHEKGVPYEITLAPPHSDELLTLNPYGKMPAIRHGDVSLFETLAIVSYIDSHFDGPALLPTNPVERSKALQWVSSILDGVVSTVLRGYIGEYVFPQGEDGTPRRDVIDANLPKIRNHIRILDAALGESDYLAGDSLGIPDLYLAPILFYLEQMPEGADILESATNISRYRKTIEGRESFTKTTPPPPPS